MRDVALTEELRRYEEALTFTSDPDERAQIEEQRIAAERELRRLDVISLSPTETEDARRAECDAHGHAWEVVLSASGPQLLVCNRCHEEYALDSSAAFERTTAVSVVCEAQGHDWRADLDGDTSVFGVVCRRCLERRPVSRGETGTA